MIQIDRSLIEQFIKDGLCKEDIIKKLAIPSSSFYRWLKLNNIAIPTSKKKYQSHEECQKIIELFKSGKKIGEISKITGRSISVLNRVLSNFRDKRKRKTDIDVAIKMSNDGKHPQEIANLFNVDVSVIRHILSRRGIIAKRNKDACEDRFDEIVNLLQSGKSQADVCSILGLHSNTLNHFIKRHSLDSITIKNFRYSSSSGEMEIVEFLREHGAMHKYKYNGLREIDVYLPDKRLGIEFCGLYWHTESRRGKRVHIDKLNDCRALGIKLITIFDDEWNCKKDIIKSIIMAKIGKSKNILYARECRLKQLDRLEAYDFLNKNHLQGAPRSCKLAFGLIAGDELVACMTFGLHHRRKDIMLLNRLAFKVDYSITGGASKLLKASIPLLKNMRVEKLTTYSDNRFSEGDVYAKMGFLMIKNLDIDYFYVKNKKRYSKQSLKKNPLEQGSGKTESQIRETQGFQKVWDCGKKMWVLDLT